MDNCVVYGLCWCMDMSTKHTDGNCVGLQIYLHNIQMDNCVGVLVYRNIQMGNCVGLQSTKIYKWIIELVYA